MEFRAGVKSYLIHNPEQEKSQAQGCTLADLAGALTNEKRVPAVPNEDCALACVHAGLHSVKDNFFPSHEGLEGEKLGDTPGCTLQGSDRGLTGVCETSCKGGESGRKPDGAPLASSPVGQSIIDEFFSEWRSICSETDEPQVLDIAEPPYPDYCARNGGGVDGLEEIEYEVSKVLGCDKTALKFLGLNSGMSYYKFISCMRWFCEKCGSHGGRIHKRRISGILRRLGAVLETIALRQFVFTMPKEWRGYFQSRAAINAFIRVCENIIKQRFPGKKSIAYFHAFGDGEGATYHPHVNIHVIEDRGQKLALSREDLRDIKKEFWRGITGYIRSQDNTFVSRWRDAEKRMNFFHSFFVDTAMIVHKLKYMSRLHPNYGDYRAVRRDLGLAKLFIVEMKGFAYIRYFNGFHCEKIKDVDRKEEVEEMKQAAGEPLRFVHDGQITRAMFDLKYRHWNYEEVNDGFYRILRE